MRNVERVDESAPTLRTPDRHRRMSLISRRRFLERSGMAVAGALLAGCDTDPLGPGSPGRLRGEKPPLRVAVVGAGMAGLAAGYELLLAGHDVTILEARPRVGGRVLTLRAPFPAGHFAEAGAARVRPEHDLTLGYAAHFGLVMDRFYPPSGLFLQVADGRRIDLSAERFLSERPDYLKVRGGTDRLPLAFASELGSRIRLDTPVTSVEQDGESVRLRGTDLELTADLALCTVPLPVLGRIAFSPPLSPEKRAAAAGGFHYQPATRVFVRFRERFWEGGGYNGWAVTDWPEELWHPTWDVAGPEGLLLTYVRGERAEALDALSPHARVEQVLAHWEDVFPGATLHAEDATSWSWGLDPWAGGAWAAPTVGEESELGPHLDRPEGRLHFAGEHASAWRGWMQGALASGLKAAEAIHARA